MGVFGSGVCWIDFEGFGNAGYGYFDGFFLVGGESAVCEGGVEVVDYGEREALLCGRHLVVIWCEQMVGRTMNILKLRSVIRARCASSLVVEYVEVEADGEL